MYSRGGSDKSRKPLVVLVGVAAGLIAVFTFITGQQSIPELLAAPTDRGSALVAPAPTLAPVPGSTPTLPANGYGARTARLSWHVPAGEFPDGQPGGGASNPGTTTTPGVPGCFLD